MHNLDEILCSYLEKLWEDGDTKTMASYALASIQFHRPALKGQLKQSWQLLSLWNKLEQPRRATPLDPQLLLAFAGIFLKWHWRDLAHLCVVGFCGLLRTGEMFQLRREPVVLPRQKGQSAILFLHDTKTAQRNLLQQEKILISEEMGIRSLQALCKGKATGELLTEVSPARFRKLWKEVVSHLKLGQFNYMPYSLRRGAATSAYREGMSFDKLLVKGRWQHIATCRLYLDQALQKYTALSLPMDALPEAVDAIAFLPPKTIVIASKRSWHGLNYARLQFYNAGDLGHSTAPMFMRGFDGHITSLMVLGNDLLFAATFTKAGALFPRQKG
eukprot:s1270_g33.t1